MPGRVHPVGGGAGDAERVEWRPGSGQFGVLRAGREERIQIPVVGEERCEIGAVQFVQPLGDGGVVGPWFRQLTVVYRDGRPCKPRTPHGLRHTAITAALDVSGGDVRAAARFSRHADGRTLQRYDDNRTDLGGELARRVAELV